jgi:hypothetical protein
MILKLLIVVILGGVSFVLNNIKLKNPPPHKGGFFIYKIIIRIFINKTVCKTKFQ